MARDRSPIVKQSRREGYALHPKAHKYLVKKQGGPGQHPQGGRRRQPSQYAIQLREKQKVRRLYGLMEKQFANLFTKAAKQQGSTGENALIMLESRLDNLIYRAGFATSRRASRQLVTHGHFNVNGRRANVPSMMVGPEDIVELKPKSTKNEYFKHLDDNSPKPSSLPAWFEVDRKAVKITVKTKPTREDAEDEIQDQFIVEYYSR